MTRIPNSVIINIGAPVFLLTLAALLMFTIPVTDGVLKDERLNVAFIAFLTFVTLKIVVRNATRIAFDRLTDHTAWLHMHSMPHA